VTPPEHSEHIAAELPRAEFVMVPGAGHLVLLETPEQVNEPLAALVARSIETHEPHEPVG
jgi:pimeloyl-ACP methyl ester carboxylesterase